MCLCLFACSTPAARAPKWRTDAGQPRTHVGELTAGCHVGSHVGAHCPLPIAQWHCCSSAWSLASSSSTATQQQRQKFQPFVLHACGIKICQGQHFHAGHLLPATVPSSQCPVTSFQFLLQLAAFESHVPLPSTRCPLGVAPKC